MGCSAGGEGLEGGKWVVGCSAGGEGLEGGEWVVECSAGGEGVEGGEWVMGCSEGGEGVVENLVDCALFCLRKRNVFHDHYINQGKGLVNHNIFYNFIYLCRFPLL